LRAPFSAVVAQPGEAPGNGQEAHHAGAALLTGLRCNLKELRRRCRAATSFPSEAMALLRASGMLMAPLPVRLGGAGWGMDAEESVRFCEALRLLGRTDLSLGRLYEAHVNAAVLVHRYGSAAQLSAFAADLHAGHLFALWVTAIPALRLTPISGGFRLTGNPQFCSAGGFAMRALVLANDGETGDRLVLIDAKAAVPEGEAAPLHGMRLTATRPMCLDGVIGEDALIGVAGDYLREPLFSAGAWRTSAVTAGGLEALVQETAQQLVARRRHAHPHQLARLGEMLMAQGAAVMWAEAAARCAEAPERPTDAVLARVSLARLAIEKACLDVISLVQRSLGLSCMLTTNPVEQQIRDLATYLRQPAADEALAEAASWFVREQA
jgi:alkylation response protein AidB-like acyl-CoA dehydrogenase